jgi:hypothetical protein
VNYYEAMRSRYSEQPHEVSIETQTVCNARCTFCPYPTLDRLGTKMPDELINRLLGEMAAFKQPFYFSPFKVNEPLLDKRTIPICQKFNEKVPRGQLRLFTNGSALTAANIDAIAGLKNVVHLWISLNSHIPEEYEQLMGLKFENTARKLDELHARYFPHPVMLSCVGFPNEPFRRYCYDRWPKFESTAIKRDAWLGYTDAQDSAVPDGPCGRWFELSIMATGVVSMCCMDGTGEHAIGDVNSQTLLEVYNTPRLRERRERLVSRRTVGEPCHRCTY